MSDIFETTTFERDGYSFRMQKIYDNDSRSTPWESDDGHGPVSDWERGYNDFGPYPKKRPGQRVLCTDDRYRGSVRLYDWQEAIYIAKRDGWGLDGAQEANLEEQLGRRPTKGEIRERAVQLDFDRLHGWCTNEWYYIGVRVALLDLDGEEVGDTFEEALWGIESDSEDYHTEVANDLADGIIGAIAEKVANGEGTDDILTVTTDARTQYIKLRQPVGDGQAVRKVTLDEAYFCMGLNSWLAKNERKDRDGGQLEFVDDCLDYLGPLQSATCPDGYTGVWVYEVAEEYGYWVAEQVNKDAVTLEQAKAYLDSIIALGS